MICFVNSGKTSARLIEWNIDRRLGEPVRIQPFAGAMLDLYGKIKSVGNVMGCFNGAQERRGKDMLNPFIAKPDSSFLRLDDTVGREVRVAALP